MATILAPDFKHFLKLLNFKKIEYLLIGGYAVGYYGYPRATTDIDVWVAIHEKNAQALVEALHEFGFQSPDLSSELFLQEKQIIRMGVPPMRIEILTNISGVDFSSCYAERVLGKIDDIEVSIISLKHLKQNKVASGRLKDLNDLEHLI